MKEDESQVIDDVAIEVDSSFKESDLMVLDSLETEIDKARAELEKVKVELQEKKNDLKPLPARDISEDEARIVNKQITMTAEKRAQKEKIDRQKAYDNVMITGRFMNLRVPGKKVTLPYLKYADDVEKWHTFHHGKTYTIPRGFVDQINGGDEKSPCYYTPQFIQKEGPMDAENPESQVHEVLTHNKRYGFFPINF